MNPSREYLQYCSIQSGYQVAPLEKVVRLGEMAGDITRHPFLGELLPQLLFTAGSEDAKKINEHPAILWKVVNVRNYLAGQSKKKQRSPDPGDGKEG